MRRTFLLALLAGGVSVIGGARSALGCVRRGRRARGCTPPCPPYPPRAPAAIATVEELATLLVSLKKQINDSVANPSQRAELDNTLTQIMGDPNRIYQAIGSKVIANQRVTQDEVASLFNGEVRAINEQMRQLIAGH